MSVFVRFWGVRGSVPVPGPTTQRYGGNTSCVEVRSGAQRFILDAGSGIRELGLAMCAAPSAAPIHLMISHAHWDHIQGFPFFPPAYNPANRIHVYGQREGDRDIHSLLSGQMHSDYFPVQFADLGAEIVPEEIGPQPRLVGEMAVRALPAAHPGGCLSFRLDHRPSGRSVVYATDCELDQLICNADEVCPAGPASISVQGPLRRLPAPLVDFVRGATVLIADGQYTEAEYPSKVGWGHSRATTAVDFAVQVGVERLAIFHHDPMQDDAAVEAKLAACLARAAELGAELEVFAAREGVELLLA